MVIGIDISQIVYGTGVSRYTAELVKALLKIDKKNSYILFGSSLRQSSKLQAFKNELKEFNNVSFKLYRFPPLFFETLWNKLHILPIEKLVGNVDIFHTSDWLEPPTLNAAKVTTVHDMIIYLFPSSLPQKVVRNQKKKLNLAKKESKIFIADSESTKDDLAKFLQIDPGKITVVPLGVSTRFKPESEEKISSVLTKYKIKKPFILSVGTQEPRKNQSLLVEVFESIHKDFPQVNLVLTGKKGWGNEIVSDIKINSTGFVDQDDLPAIYSACHVFVYPSLYEGFGLPILEAMACGAPTITSNNSSMQEIAKDTAILIDPRSKVQLEKALKLILDLEKNDYQKMVRASIDRSRQFSWTKTARETLKIYEKVVNESQSKSN